MYVGFDSKLVTYPVREAPISPPEGVRLEHFEPIFGDSITVTTKKTILGGAKKCLFLISFDSNNPY